jgi:hypothetical protein
MMLSEAEYKELLPHREAILSRNVHRGSAYLVIADKIRQRNGMGQICFSCDGSKVEAVNDIWAMFTEYERTNP